jgi:hypothetical protein
MLRRNSWTYGSNIKDREYLMGEDSFDELAEKLSVAVCAAQKAQIRFVVEPKNRKYDSGDRLLKRLKCTRPAWWIQLDRTLLDAFFNGRMGIRAQYYKSPYHGHAKNHLLLSRIVEPLIRLAVSIEPGIEADFLHLSLNQPSAKVWISEKDIAGKEIVRASDLKFDKESIQNDWLDLAREVESGVHSGENYNLNCAALNGIRAPIPDQLEVKGSWLTGVDRCEYVTPSKRDRDCQIFMFGFS